MFTLIENGEVFAPEPLGKQSILILGERIACVGDIDVSHLRALRLPGTVVDVSGSMVMPGLIDPHAHLLGAGGEQGFTSRMPEVRLEDLIRAGVTTVIGLLGTDTTTRHIASLYARTSQITKAGLTAYSYTGGFKVPPVTLTSNLMDDLVLLDRVIGVGEIAIADYRSTEPSPRDLARLVSETILGGLIGGKAGITHFHVGEGKEQLKLLHDLLDQFDIPAHYLYPTHVARSESLLDDAIRLAQRGAFVDMDTTDEKLAHWVGYYRAHDGPPDKLTVSSDAHTPSGSHAKYFNQFCTCLEDPNIPLDQFLPFFTTNPAKVLKLDKNKGGLREGMDGDVLVLDKDTREIRYVFAKGRLVAREGEVLIPETTE